MHTTRGPGRPCHPRGRRPTFCPHGRPEHCPRVHADDDPDLGAPLCPDCYDYAGQVAFNWYAPELWRRFTITLRRRLADLLGIPRTQLGEQLVVSFAKVAEFQRRGVVHFHALIRLDGPGDNYPPPAVAGHRRAAGRRHPHRRRRGLMVTEPYNPARADLGTAVRRARSTSGPCTARPSATPRPGRCTREMVAAYIAKYATKAAEDFGLAPQRIHPLTDLATLPVSDHIRRHLATAVQIGSAAAMRAGAGLGEADPLAAHARLPRPLRHQVPPLLRHPRPAPRRTPQLAAPPHPDRWPDLDDADLDETTLVVTGSWEFVGLGWLTTGDAALAASAAARAREHRDLARDHRTTHTDQDHD